MSSKNKHEFGLCLSGGGIRGAAHIGVLEALTQEAVYPSIISGTSSGALVGAMYAADYDTKEMLRIFKSTPIFKVKYYTFRRPGLFDSKLFAAPMIPLFKDNNFKSLKRELYICSTNLIEARSQYFNEGTLVDKMIASCAYPFIFTPVEIDGILYADGGIMNNFPIEPIRDQCKKLIGVYTNPLKNLNKFGLNRSYKVMARAFLLAVSQTAVPKFRDCDYLCVPEELNDYNIFNKKYIDNCYKLGLEYGQALAEKIKKDCSIQ